jgi:hypothetical protein
MTLTELLAKLKTLPPEARVICYCEDDSMKTQCFEIDEVTLADVIPMRHEDGTVGVRFASGPESTKWVVIQITSDA